MGNSESTPGSQAGAQAAASGGTKAALSRMGASFRFGDSYTSFSALENDLRKAGLESSSLIVAVDFTKSNEWQGKHTFNGKCLHYLDPTGAALNPYQQALSIISASLAPFDDDGLIPAYGFGCGRTHDKSVFAFKANEEPCNGLPEVLARYSEVAPVTSLAGPTSFAPAIRKACEVVKRTGEYHILLIIADGSITRSSDLPAGQLSTQEQETVQAIVEASALPLSIICVGVGDGPWEQMEEFDDNIPQRAFDNFQFVPFTATLAKAHGSVPAAVRSNPSAVKAAMDATFALHALMEIPHQYKAISRGGLLGPAKISSAYVRPVATLPPPPASAAHASSRNLYPSGGGGGGGGGGGFGLDHLVAGGGGGGGGAAAPYGGYSAASSSFSSQTTGPGAVPYHHASVVAPPPQTGSAPFGAGYTKQQPYSEPITTTTAAASRPSSTVAASNASGSGGVASSSGPSLGPSASATEAAKLRQELEATRQAQECPVCLTNAKNCAFGCGHTTCWDCGQQIRDCPICRQKIETRIKLFT